jgi:hypothetical protein
MIQIFVYCTVSLLIGSRSFEGTISYPRENWLNFSFISDKTPISVFLLTLHITQSIEEVDSSWNVMVHGDEREGKWRGNWRMEWVASTVHTTSEHGVSNITTITIADAHSSAVSSRLYWRPRRFEWSRPFRRKTKSGFCACVITFRTQSNYVSFL